jgi:hypothetical protein
LHNGEVNFMKKINVSLVALAIIVIAATSFSIIAQAAQVAGFNTYQNCVDDSECGGDGYCVDGKCIKSKEKKGCVDDSECGEGEYCVGGECQETKRW